MDPVDFDRELRQLSDLVNSNAADEALRMSREIALRFPDRPECQYLFGYCLLRNGDALAADRSLTKAIEAGHNLYWAYWNRAVARHSLGRSYEAVEDAKCAVAIDQSPDGALRFLTQTLLPAVNGVSGGTPLSAGEAAAAAVLPQRRFWKPDLTYENSVRSALLDLIRPGDVIFDVGANIGGLVLVAARAAGPTGRVIAFEASPRNLPALVDVVSGNALFNTWVVNRAVYRTAGDRIKIYFNAAGYSDSLYVGSDSPGSEFAEIETVTLDSYAAAHGIFPRIIKIDVEFAELDVLQGATSLLERRDVLILCEVWHDIPGPVQFLLERGFVGCSLESLEVFTTLEGFARARIGNALFYRPEARVPPLYAQAKLDRIEGVAGAWAGERADLMTSLPAGRYVASVDLGLALDHGGHASLKVLHRDQPIVDVRWPVRKYSEVPFFIRVDQPGEVKFQISLDGSAQDGANVRVRLDHAHGG